MKFVDKLTQAVKVANSNLCVGLDPYLERIPENIKQQHSSPHKQVYHFLKTVIEVTAPDCAAYKPNLGFFEALGAGGLEVFEWVTGHIPDDKIIIADAKRGDISSTADHYAKAYFEKFDVDAITINPLMGLDTLTPFADYEEKGVFVLTLTSNPGATDFLTQPFGGEDTMAAYIASKLHQLNNESATHFGMVTGATNTDDLGAVLQKHPRAALLIPGIGAQGGSLDEFKSLLNEHEGVPLFNSSRGILYAGEEQDDWQGAVEAQAKHSKDEINSILAS